MALFNIWGYQADWSVIPRVQTLVFGKDAWADDWTYWPYVYPTEATESAAPSVGRAQLRYDYGYIKREDWSVFALWERNLRLKRQLVKIVAYDYYTSVDLWYGIVDLESVKPYGSVVGGHIKGRQTFQANGLEHLLDRRYIVGAYTDVGYVDRPLTFNKPSVMGLDLQGNRSDEVDESGAYCFSTDGNLWSNLQIAEYVLTHLAAGTGLTWALSGATDALDAIYEVHALEGLSALQCLNKLIRRQRGLSFRTWVDETSGVVYLYVFSLLSAPLLAADAYLPANPDQALVDTTDSRDAEIEVSYSDLALYDRIVVKGGPITSCFSMSYADGTLRAHFSVAQAAAYKAGSAKVGATAADHDAARQSEELENVYTKYGLNPETTWDWYAGNGIGGTKYNAGPGCNPDGTVNAAIEAPQWMAEKKFERQLPLFATAVDEDALPDYRKPFVLVNTDQGYQYVDKLQIRNDDGELVDRPASVTVANRDLAIYVRGHPPHLFAGASWSGAAETETEPQFAGQSFIATMNVKTDAHLRVWLALPWVAAVPGGRTLVLEVEDAEAWYIVPGTVVDIDDENALVHHTGGLVRDDSWRLRQIALFAAAWYGQQRGTVQLQFANIRTMLPVGFLVSGLLNSYATAGYGAMDYYPVGTVVTTRRWDFTNGRTQILTNFEELDIAAMAGGRGL